MNSSQQVLDTWQTAATRATGSRPASAVLPPPREKWAGIIKEMDRLGLTYRLEPQFDLDSLDIATRRIQVRENDHVAPKDTVRRFSIQMGQTEFPPIIVTADCWVVDGNTRKEAKRLRDEKFHPAFVLDIVHATASAHELNLLWILGATLNAANGLPLTAAERRKSVEAMISENWKGEQIARALGVNQGVITKIRRELEAQAKMQRLRIPVDKSMSMAGLRALGTPDVLALNDKPYTDLTVLARDAGLGFNEIREIAKEMRDTGSDAGALEVATAKRVELRDRITSTHLTGFSRPPASAILRARLAYATGFIGREHELVERNDEIIEKHLALIDQTIAVLTRVKELQTS